MLISDDRTATFQPENGKEFVILVQRGKDRIGLFTAKIRYIC